LSIPDAGEGINMGFSDPSSEPIISSQARMKSVTSKSLTKSGVAAPRRKLTRDIDFLLLTLLLEFVEEIFATTKSGSFFDKFIAVDQDTDRCSVANGVTTLCYVGQSLVRGSSVNEQRK
jgi:hypothetical protein